jgi:hypothetical protein
MDLHRDPLPLLFRYRKEIGFSYTILNALLRKRDLQPQDPGQRR